MAVAKKILGYMERSSWIRKMFEEGVRLKAQYGADKVCDLSLGNPNLEPPPAVDEALLQLINEKKPMQHAYMPNAGYPDVRGQVAAYLEKEQGVKLKADHVVMTCGAAGALNAALKTILNPGDQVVAPVPCFMEYNFYVDNHGGELVLASSQADFDLDIPALAAKITPATAAVLINSPNNPTGRVYPESTVKALGEMLAAKSREVGRAIYLISDEPYRKIIYDGVTVPSLFKYYPHSMVATSYSKDLSLPGERIGFLAVNPEADDLANLMGGIILNNRILGYVNAPALMQRLAGRLQGLSVDVGVYRKKRDLLCGELARLGYKFHKPEGAFYLFPQCPGGDDLKFVAALQEELVLVVPGRGCGLPGYFRIAYCVDDAVIERSFAGFAKVAKKLG